MQLRNIFFAGAFIASPALAQNSDWLGPLPLENERPLQSIFLHLPAQSPEALTRGQTRLGVQLDIANNLLIPAVGPNGESVTEDFETQRLKVSWRRGLGRGLEFGASANLSARNGGFTDLPIELYHHLLRLPGQDIDNPAGRDNLPRNRSILQYRNAQGQGINKGSAFGLGDTSFWLKKQLSSGKFASAARVALKAPTGSEGKILGSGSFDGGFLVDARYAFARKWALFGNLGAAKYGHSSLPGARGSGWQAGIGFEWRVGKNSSIILQSDAASRAVTTGNPLADRTPVIGSIGFKKRLSKGRTFWIALAENGDYQDYRVPTFGNIAPDAGFSFGYEISR